MALISETKVKILKALREHPTHGYGIYVQTDLSLGSIYDHLGRLEENGFVKGEKKGRIKVYHLTKKGRTLLKALE